MGKSEKSWCIVCGGPVGAGRDVARPENGMERLVSPKEFAEYLGKTVNHLYVMKHAGQLPVAVRLGRRVMWRESDIAAWLEANLEGSK